MFNCSDILLQFYICTIYLVYDCVLLDFLLFSHKQRIYSMADQRHRLCVSRKGQGCPNFELVILSLSSVETMVLFRKLSSLNKVADWLSRRIGGEIFLFISPFPLCWCFEADLVRQGTIEAAKWQEDTRHYRRRILMAAYF